MTDRQNGPLRHTFTGIERSPTRFSSKGKTLTLTSAAVFVVDAEVSHDAGLTWTLIESFVSDTVKNFEWKGDNALISFNCTTYNSDIELIFE